jgi:hypothetical protein
MLHSASILSGDNEISNAVSEDPFFKKYMLKIRSEFLNLATSVKISEIDFRNLLIIKSVENDAFGLVIRVLNKDIMDKEYALKFISALEGGSNDLLWLAFNRQEVALAGILYVEKWGR